MDYLIQIVPLVLKLNTYKTVFVKTLVIQDSMKMKKTILVSHVTKIVKNVLPEPVMTVLNVMNTPT